MSTGPVLVWDSEALNSMSPPDKEAADGEDRAAKSAAWDSYKTYAGISVAVVYNRTDKTWHFFTASDLPGGGHGIRDLYEFLKAASVVVSFNGLVYDNVVLANDLGLPGETVEQQLARSPLKLWDNECDVLKVIRKSVGWNWPRGSWTLDAICERTFGLTKTMDGAGAPQAWEERRIGQLVYYCWNDVRLLEELYRFIGRLGYVIGPGGKKMEVGS